MRELIFVALPRPARGPLRTPAQVDQHLPDVAGMIAHAKFALDQVSHTGTSPQRSFIAQRFRSVQQQFFQTLPVFGRQARLASGASGFFQTGFALATTLRDPAAHGLANDFHLAGDGRRPLAPLPQTDGLEPTFLQLLKVATHSSRVSHTGLDAGTPEMVAILCETQ